MVLAFLLMKRFTAFFLIVVYANSSLANEKKTATLEGWNDWYTHAMTERLNAPKVYRQQGFDYLHLLEKAGSKDTHWLYYFIALTHSDIGEYDESIHYLSKALSSIEQEENIDQYIQLLILLGNNYADKYEHVKAYEYYSLALHETIKYGLEDCVEYEIRSNIAFVFLKVADYRGALEVLEMIPLKNRCLHRRQFIVLTSYVHHRLQDDEKALAIFERYSSVLDSDKRRVIQMSNKHVKSTLLVSLGRLEEAFPLVEEVTQYMEENPEYFVYWQRFYLLARFYAGKGDNRKAIEYALDTLSEPQSLPKEAWLSLEVEILPLIIDLYLELGDEQQANIYMHRLRKSGAAYYDRNRAALLSIAQAKFDLAGRDAKIALLSAENQLHEVRVHESHIVVIALAFALLFFTGLSFRFYHDSRRNKAIHRVLDVHSREKQRQIQDFEVKLSEKDMLLEESHHRFKNNMQLLSNLLELQYYQLSPEKTDQVSSIIGDTINRIEVMSLIQHFSFHKNEKKLPFINVLEKLSNQFSVVNNNIIINILCDEVDFSHDLSKSLLLIINELITNAQKHAFGEGGGCIDVIIKNEAGLNYELIVRDSGRGIPDKYIDPMYEGSLGLKLVKALISQIDGTFQIHSDSEGTCWTIKL